MILMHGDDCEEDVSEVETVEEPERPDIESTRPEISLNSVVGITSPKAMKMVGEVLDHPMMVMIDPGATHNFVSLKTVQKLGIPVSSSKHFDASLGTGDRVQGKGECKSVVL